MSQRFYRVKDLIKIPKELRSIYYFGKLTRIERVRVLNFLKKWFNTKIIQKTRFNPRKMKKAIRLNVRLTRTAD